MKFVNLVLLLLLSVTCVMCSSEKRMANKKLLRLLKQFRCNKPQARVFELEEVVPEDILEKYQGMRRSIKPAVTILHRCYSSGCCEDPEERCMPAETKNVTLTFVVFQTRYLEYFQAEATNHTECACMRNDASNIK